jgi:hypothetical protein
MSKRILVISLHPAPAGVRPITPLGDGWVQAYAVSGGVAPSGSAP